MSETNNLIPMNQPGLVERNVTFDDLIHEWLESRGFRSPQTKINYQRSMKKFQEWMRSEGITAPRKKDLVRYLDYLQTVVNPNSANVHFACLRAFFKWTSQEEGQYHYPNYTANIEPLAVSPDHKRDAFTTDQAQELLDSIDDSTEEGARLKAITLLVLTTGLRANSIRLANVGDIRQVDGVVAMFYQGKGRAAKDEPVVIQPITERAIRHYLSFRKDKKLDDPLFTGNSNRNRGGRLSTQTISKAFKNQCIKIGLDSDRLVFHSLRHTFATSVLNDEKQRTTVQELSQAMGHSNITTTMQYVHEKNKLKNPASAVAASYYK